MNRTDELIVDSFAGGGGASTGIELATVRVVDIAINHDPDAILMHRTNHPHTQHFQASVWDVDPVEVCRGRKVGLLWASPDCKHFSKARGGKPVGKNIRGLAWIVIRWAGTVKPRVIILENVEEFKTWGPVRRGRPVKSKTGQTFRKFISQLEAPRAYLVVVNHAGEFRGQEVDSPLQTITAKHGYGVASPMMAPWTVTNTTNSTGHPLNEPVDTARTGGGGGPLCQSTQRSPSSSPLTRKKLRASHP